MRPVMREMKVVAYGSRSFLSLMSSLGVEILVEEGSTSALEEALKGDVGIVLVEEGLEGDVKVKRRRGEIYPIVLRIPRPGVVDEGEVKRYYTLMVRRMLGYAMRL